MAEGNVGSWRYSYDPSNRPTQTVNPYNEVSGQSYDTDGRPYQQTAPNGVVTTLGYDALSRVTSVQWGVASALGSINYDVCAYDPMGELIRRDENGGSSTFYGYDGAGQLATEQRTGSLPYAAAYTYDGNANRLSKTLTDGSHTAAVDRYQYDAADKLLSVQGGILGNRTYGYTGAGEVRTLSQGGATWTLDWDASGHPYHTDYGNSAYSAFAVNGLGQRVFSRTADGQAHYTVAAGAEPGSPLLSDMTGGGAGRVYTPGVGQRDLSTNVSRFALTDALGGTRALLGSDRSPLDDLRYDAFGGTIYHGGGSPGSVPLGWGASSGYQSDDSGLVLMGNRYYDPAIGRFLSPDPSGDGDNWYAYCQNDPVDDTDPDGLKDQSGQGGDDGTPTPISTGPPTWIYGTPSVWGVFLHGLSGMAPVSMAASIGRGGGQGRPVSVKPPLSAYKAALRAVHAKVGRLYGIDRVKRNAETGPKASPMRQRGKIRYRLDPPHPPRDGRNAVEESIHFNYDDFTNGKRGAGGISEAIPVEGGVYGALDVLPDEAGDADTQGVGTMGHMDLPYP